MNLSPPTDFGFVILETSILVFGERYSVYSANDLWQLYNPTKPAHCLLHSLGSWAPHVGLQRAEMISICRTVPIATLQDKTPNYIYPSDQLR